MKVLKNILGQKDNQGLRKLALGSTHPACTKALDSIPNTKKMGARRKTESTRVHTTR